MGDNDKKLIEKLEVDFHTLSSKDGWTKDDLEKMKNLQKLMYYMEVRCAMKEGEEYPGSKYMDGQSYDSHPYYDGNSYRSMPQHNPSNGRFMSGHGYPVGYSYGMSGRRYYDSERDKFVNELHRAMSSESDPEMRAEMENLARMLAMR